MDLSWCIICDRHSIEDNLYCSEACRIKDALSQQTTPVLTTPLSPPSSPLLSCYGRHHHKAPAASYIPSPPGSPILSYLDS
ncbi:hypothetical protein BJV82DRAFT_628110 [Fennellomyces sp. T-0311]|nr:hypothetical protein BJV82DRAFT_628110 [Fennellomyces sp. T-0311]